MPIIAGKIHVAPERRDEHVASMAAFVEATRSEPGCLDFSITADPVEAGRVDLLERWAPNDQLRAFQARAEPPDLDTEVLGEDVTLYEIGSPGPTFPE